MKLVKVQTYFVPKEGTHKGEKVICYNYYLVFDNGIKVAIKPVFDNDRSKLFTLGEWNNNENV